MDIIVQSVGFKASEALEALVREKVTKLDTLSDKIIRANVTFYEASKGNPENNICEIRLEVPGNDHFVKKGSALYEQALLECIDTLQNIMQKKKNIENSRRQAAAKASGT
jgi:ribosome-associated translation inhibitor RaiA